MICMKGFRIMNKLSEKQIQLLIDFVEARPGIYDKNEPSYKKVEWKHKCWKEISSTLFADEKDCRDAWRSLRDQFVKRLKELNDKTGQSAEECPKKYKNFHRLLFLKDYIDPRKNCNYDDDCSTINHELSLLDYDVKDSMSIVNAATVPYMSPVSASTSCSSGTKRKIFTQPEPIFNFVQCAPTSHKGSEIQDVFYESSSCSSFKKKKSENLKDNSSGLSHKLAHATATKEPDNIDTFFESMGKSVKSFSLTPVEQTKLMMGVTELLYKIVSDKHK